MPAELAREEVGDYVILAARLLNDVDSDCRRGCKLATATLTTASSRSTMLAFLTVTTVFYTVLTLELSGKCCLPIFATCLFLLRVVIRSTNLVCLRLKSTHLRTMM